MIADRELVADIIYGEFTQWLDDELGFYGATIGGDGTLEGFRNHIHKRVKRDTSKIRLAFEDLLDMYIKNHRWRLPPQP